MPVYSAVAGNWWEMEKSFSLAFALVTVRNLHGGKDHVSTHRFDLEGLEETLQQLAGKPVYLQ